MNIKINQCAYIHNIGKRDNNEDNLSFNSESGAFVLSDGVGGHEKGEIASEIVVNAFVHGLASSKYPDPSFLLGEAEQSMVTYIDNNPVSEGMAATITMSKVVSDGVLIGWVGDSRIYQFRKGQIHFQTTDHSWVNEAVQAGIISANEAENHPKKNVITRAIQGVKPTKIDFTTLNDIQDGDWFLHCSDGLLESWSNVELSQLFSGTKSAEELKDVLEQKCLQYSKDNFSAIIYQVQLLGQPSDGNNEFVTAEMDKEEGLVSSLTKYLVITVLVLAGLGVLAWKMEWIGGVSNGEVKQQQEQGQQQKQSLPQEQTQQQTQEPQGRQDPQQEQGQQEKQEPHQEQGQQEKQEPQQEQSQQEKQEPQQEQRILGQEKSQ